MSSGKIVLYVYLGLFALICFLLAVVYPGEHPYYSNGKETFYIQGILLLYPWFLLLLAYWAAKIVPNLSHRFFVRILRTIAILFVALTPSGFLMGLGVQVFACPGLSLFDLGGACHSLVGNVFNNAGAFFFVGGIPLFILGVLLFLGAGFIDTKKAAEAKGSFDVR